MQSMQNLKANSEKHETILEPADGRNLLEAKLQDVNVDSSVGQSNEDKESNLSNAHLVSTGSNGSELGMREEESCFINGTKASSFGENQTNVKFSNNENLSSFTSLEHDSNTALLENGKALESGIQLSNGDPSTLKSPEETRILPELLHSEESSEQKEIEDQATCHMHLLAESNNIADSCTGIESKDDKDSNVDLQLTANTNKEDSSTHEEMKTLKQSSDELVECQKESVLANNVTGEVQEMLTAGSSYTQENEHSYVSKIAAFEDMDKLELSPSSNEASDIEDMDTNNACNSDQESPGKTNEEESLSNDKLHLADPSAEAAVSLFHQNDDRSPENDRCLGNAVVMQVSDPDTEMNGNEKPDEILAGQIPLPPCNLGADRIHSIPGVSAGLQANCTEDVDRTLFKPNKVGHIFEMDKGEEPSVNTWTFCDKEDSPQIFSKIFEEDTKCYGKKSSSIDSEDINTADLENLGEKSLLPASEPSKVVNLESPGEKSLLITSTSSMTADLESPDKKASMLDSEFSRAANWKSIGENPPSLGSESSKTAVFESLEEKASLLASESSKTADSESLEEKASLLGSDKAADLESIEEKTSLHDFESSNAADFECTSVFEKLSLEAVSETYTTQISTPAEKQELQMEMQIHSTENLHAEKETIDSTIFSDVLHTEDNLVPDCKETENRCEILEAPTSEAMNEVTTITLVKKSESENPHDSDGATNLPVSTCVDGNVDQLPVIPKSDVTSDAVNVMLAPEQHEKSTKKETQCKKDTTRKEILSKLKRICAGSGISQQTSSNSEDEVFIVHEKPGKWHTGEQKKQADVKIVNLSKPELNTISLAENTSKTQENQTAKSEIPKEKMLQEIASNNISIASVQPVISQETEPLVSQDKCRTPPYDDFTDNMDQDSVQDPSEICCILNTGSISKEQYDRWSDTSDEDIEFLQAYKEPLTRLTSEYFQEECHEFPSSPTEELTFYNEVSRSRKAKHFKRQSGPSASLWEKDEYVSRYHRNSSYPSPKSYGSLIITKKLNDVGRTWPTVHKESVCVGRSELDSIFANRRMVSNDLTQKTLDMEHLRFMCSLKDILRKSSTDVHVSEPPFQTLFDSRSVPGSSGSRSKCRSPLLITVHCQQQRRDYRGHDNLFPSSYYGHPYYEDELRDKPAYYSRTSKKLRTHSYSSPYHFNRLRYESTLDKPNSDISVIIKECTHANHLKLSRVGLSSTATERTSTYPVPEESDWQTRWTLDSTSTKSQTVGNIISDLCTNLHSRLHGVARESTCKNCYFYLSKNNDDDDNDDFFSLTKSLLIKDGYTPIEPQEFCDRQEAESNTLLVIIRNEDVSSQIHKVPCLLQLKLLPNVTFAGVDTPEDLSESVHQDLFQMGGFVVSDKGLLENITIGKLKEVLTILEKMNRTSAWKWFIHYGEFRKLKEDKRTESVSRLKIPLLKSYQQSNVIEILPYHRCDSRTKDLSSDLKCLLGLQSQHIHSRLAVYLSVMPSTETEEFEHNGFLVYDVDTFIRRIQKVDAQLQSSFWL
uniref:Protein FAM208B n=1 Tax=Pyxicephalus adspersus TaxID=30357 RepID=A0AAV3B098_PYXAD|nr:TPA: hypothetical protein GDO54_007281 [Pyxicephalus adspersus]